MVNINIALPPELHKRLKIAAALGGTTIKELVIDLLGTDHPDPGVR